MVNLLKGTAKQIVEYCPIHADIGCVVGQPIHQVSLLHVESHNWTDHEVPSKSVQVPI